MKTFPLFVGLLVLSHTLFAEVQTTSTVTASDYCDFLNAHVIADEHDFYNEAMGSDPYAACIVRLGTPGNYQYEVIAGRKDLPVMYVTGVAQKYYESWIKNGQLPGELRTNSVNKECADFFLACNRLSFSVTSSSNESALFSAAKIEVEVDSLSARTIGEIALGVILSAIAVDEAVDTQTLSTRLGLRGGDDIIRPPTKTTGFLEGYNSEENVQAGMLGRKILSVEDENQTKRASELQEKLANFLSVISVARESFLNERIKSALYEKNSGHEVMPSILSAPTLVEEMDALDKRINKLVREISSLIAFKKEIFVGNVVAEGYTATPANIFSSAESLCEEFENQLNPEYTNSLVQKFKKRADANLAFSRAFDQQSMTLAKEIVDAKADLDEKKDELRAEALRAKTTNGIVFIFDHVHEQDRKQTKIEELEGEIQKGEKNLKEKRRLIEVERENLKKVTEILLPEHQAVDGLVEALAKLKVAEENYVSDFLLPNNGAINGIFRVSETPQVNTALKQAWSDLEKAIKQHEQTLITSKNGACALESNLSATGSREIISQPSVAPSLQRHYPKGFGLKNFQQMIENNKKFLHHPNDSVFHGGLRQNDLVNKSDK